MRCEPIGRLVYKTKQIDPINSGYTSFIYVDISSIDKDTKTIIYPQIIPVENAPSRARKEIRTNDILISTVRPNLNSVAIVPEKYNYQIASTGFCVLRTDGTLLDPYYLYYFTQTDRFITRLTKLSIGAGYPAVSEGDILETEIPLPPLPEQQRMAKTLQKADRIRQLRRYARQLSDGYLQSVFLEMFGDPASNPRGFPTKKLGDILSKERFALVDGPFGSHLKANEYTESGVRVIRVNNIKPNNFNFDDIRYVSEQKYLTIKRSTARPGDILMAKVGNTIGKTCIFPSEIPYAVLTANVCKISTDPKIACAFFIGFQMNLGFRQKQIRNLSGDTAKPMINLQSLKELILMVPPLNEQQRFIQIATDFGRLNNKFNESERQAELLFQSLLHQAFE